MVNFDSVVWVNLKKFLDQILSIFATIWRCLELSFLYFFESLFDCFLLKWRFTCQKSIKNAAKTPNVCFDVVFLICQHFWCNIVWCTAKSISFWIKWNFGGKSKINYLYSVAVFFQHNIAQFEISVENIDVLKILNTLHNLLKNWCDLCLGYILCLFYEII